MGWERRAGKEKPGSEEQLDLLLEETRKARSKGVEKLLERQFPAGSAPGNGCFYGILLPGPCFVGISGASLGWGLRGAGEGSPPRPQIPAGNF